jgi:hypothetical protein
MLQDAPSKSTNPHKHEELDIHQLLGIKNKPKDELLFGNKKV